MDEYIYNSTKEMNYLIKLHKQLDNPNIKNELKNELLELIYDVRKNYYKQKNEYEINKQIWKNPGNPSKTDTYWLFWSEYSDYGNIGDGKWMLFFDINEIDKEWDKFKKLYDDSELDGVISMKVSGSKNNPRASNVNNKVIILYCNGTRENIMEVGHNIVSKLDNYKSEYIYYKSNNQTKEGTRATGQNKNYLYKIPINKKISNKVNILKQCICHDNCTNWPMCMGEFK